MLRDRIIEFFGELDDFHKEFASQLKNRPCLQDSPVKRCHRKGKMSGSEMMGIYVLFHFGQFTNFKNFYSHYVQSHLADLFPDPVGYGRFSARQERMPTPLMATSSTATLANPGALTALVPPCSGSATSSGRNSRKRSRALPKRGNSPWAGSSGPNCT